MKELTDSRDFLDKDVKVVIDRQLGSKHHIFGNVYMLNYGYIPDTLSTDGAELDAFLVGVFKPVETFEGHVIAIIHRTNDNGDKLVVAPKVVNYSDDAIRALTEFQEKIFESIIVR